MLGCITVKTLREKCIIYVDTLICLPNLSCLEFILNKINEIEWWNKLIHNYHYYGFKSVQCE